MDIYIVFNISATVINKIALYVLQYTVQYIYKLKKCISIHKSIIKYIISI